MIVRIVYEKQNKHYAFDVFPEQLLPEMLYTLGKGRGNPNLFLFEHVRFITDAWQIFVTHSKYRSA